MAISKKLIFSGLTATVILAPWRLAVLIRTRRHLPLGLSQLLPASAESSSVAV